jgi:hypothetical protein
MHVQQRRELQLVVMTPTEHTHHIDSLSGRAELMQADWPDGWMMPLTYGVQNLRVYTAVYD